VRSVGKGVLGGVPALALALLGLVPATAVAARHARASATPPAPTTTPTPTVTLLAPRRAFTSGHLVVLTGRVSDVPPGSVVWLYKSPFPYPVAKLVRRTAPAADGSFSFRVFPDRDARYRAIVPGTPAQALVQVKVADRIRTTVKALPLGRGRVTVVVFHPRDLRWNGARVRWEFGTGSHGRFLNALVTRTRRLSPTATALSATITYPAGRFHWQACFHAPADHALENALRPHGCTGRGYRGVGVLPVGFPSPTAIGRAAGFLASRAGRTAFAVVDSEGRESGVREHWTFVSASVVKAMLLVAYLRRLDARGQHHIDSFSNSFLFPMINVSDNSAATQTWSIVGDSGLYAVAHAAGMTDFSIVGIWANAQISAADQAKFFFKMDSLIPHEFVGYAHFLLSTIVGFESWGIPAVARPRGYAVWFKGGWRGTGLGQLVHQVGRLSGHGRTFSIAVMTDGDPSMGYGIGTIQGVTASLL
jgi:hypothetical protein